MSPTFQQDTNAKGRGLGTADAGRVWAVAEDVIGSAIATPTTTKAGQGATPSRPISRSSSSSFRVIEPSSQEGVTVAQVLLGNPQQARTIVPFLSRRPAPHGNQYVTQRPREVGVCAFHPSISVNRPALEPST
jgi:hypothetical protein